MISLRKWEGGWVCHKDDPGGETYNGIARVHNPAWSGWQIIDAIKAAGGGGLAMDASAPLRAAVHGYYRSTYWGNLDLIEDALTTWLIFEAGVLHGVQTSQAWAQHAANALNCNGTLWPDVFVDGQIGAASAFAINRCVKQYPTEWRQLFEAQRVVQVITSTQRNPKAEVFMVGWLKRFKG